VAKCVDKEFSACSNGVGFLLAPLFCKYNFGPKQLQCGIKPEADIERERYIYIDIFHLFSLKN
jgi:hypothetical protein